MDAEAVNQARARLRKAELSLGELRTALTLEQAEAAWTDFLLAASTIYTKLEQGAKGHSQSAPWFGKKKHERKSDELLRYLHYARNSDEHGIRRVAATTGPNFHYEDQRPLGFNERVPVQFQLTNQQTGEPEGPMLNAVLAGPTLKPIRVTDTRFGDFCDPPQMHMGQEILYANFVDGIAAAAMPHLREMLAEAEKLAK